MKIGILTLPLHINFGGFLQNYALQQVLKKLGHEPITLNQRPIPRSTLLQIIGIIAANLHTFALCLFGMRGRRRFIHYHGTSMRQRMWKNSTYFYDTYISHTKPMNPNTDYVGVSSRFGLGALVVGSDQVWRPKYVENLYAVYLNFEDRPDVKKIAYAVSFGTNEWEYTDAQTKECRKLVQTFDLITVRESSGKQLINSFLSANAEVVLDPTLLLEKEDYIKIVEREHEAKSEGNLFCYILDMTDDKRKLITNVENQLGLKSFFVNIGEDTRPYTNKFINNNIERFQNPTVTKWLRGFIDADMVIADSFHAVVFSIIFNKSFWVIGNPGRGMARFESILSLFKLQNRLVDLDSIKDRNLMEPIDWDFVNEIKRGWKEKSIRLLQNTLNN